MALADRAASAQPLQQFKVAWLRAARLTASARGLPILCAMSCALLLTACARDTVQREPNPPPHPEIKSAVVRVTPHSRRSQEQNRQEQNRQAQHRQEQHGHASQPIHRVDPALLAPQPAPDCEYNRLDLKSVDADEWSRLKAEYERQCYREAEKAARERLGLLQASLKQAQH